MSARGALSSIVRRRLKHWLEVRELFETDDGSLPDIYFENLKPAEIVAIYESVMSRCSVFGEPTVWSIAEVRDVPLSKYPRPAQAFVEGRIEQFRHGLAELNVNGNVVPQLTISVEPGGISFDYRKGSEWDEQTVSALFVLITELQRIAPDAVVFQAEEGCADRPSEVFTRALGEFAAGDA